MEVTKKYVAGLIGVIKNEYPREYGTMNEQNLLAKIELWYRSLARYPKEVVEVALQRALETSKYPPTLAEIVGNVKEIKEATEPTDTELWAELCRVFRKVNGCTYRFKYNAIDYNGKTQGENARAEFNAIWDGLPPVLKSYCGNKGGLISLADMDEDELAFEKGRFLKAVPTLKQRQEIRDTVEASVLALASEEKLQIEDVKECMLLTDTK